MGNSQSSDQSTDPLLKELSTDRVISSIPKSDGNSNWVYPSEQMFYDAMKKKGWSQCPHDPSNLNVDKETMSSIIKIHNVNNERTWSEIKQWEKWRNCTDLKLKKFHGTQDKLSPRARFRHLLGYQKPFDRHDWYVDACQRKSVRYVIDYYDGNEKENLEVAYIDARPACDRLSSVWLRLNVSLARAKENFKHLWKS